MKWPTYLLILSITLFFFHGSLLGYFAYVIALGIKGGTFLYSILSMFAAVLVLVPLVLKKVKGTFYFHVFLYANLWVAFNPFVFQFVGNIF